MRVDQLARRGLVTAELAETLRTAAARMREADVSAMPVLEEGRLVGIITERDFTRAAAQGADPSHHMVAAFMTLGPYTVYPGEDSQDVAARMLELGVRHLPLIDHDRLIGMVSMRDLLLLEALQERRPRSA